MYLDVCFTGKLVTFIYLLSCKSRQNIAAFLIPVFRIAMIFIVHSLLLWGDKCLLCCHIHICPFVSHSSTDNYCASFWVIIKLGRIIMLLTVTLSFCCLYVLSSVISVWWMCRCLKWEYHWQDLMRDPEVFMLSSNIKQYSIWGKYLAFGLMA